MITNLNDILVIYVIAGIVSGFTSGFIASTKRSSFLGWFIVGFLFSAFGVVAAAASPRNEKVCPKCGEFSAMGVHECGTCGYIFFKEPGEKQSPNSKGKIFDYDTDVEEITDRPLIR